MLIQVRCKVLASNFEPILKQPPIDSCLKLTIFIYESLGMLLNTLVSMLWNFMICYYDTESKKCVRKESIFIWLPTRSNQKLVNFNSQSFTYLNAQNLFIIFVLKARLKFSSTFIS